MILMYGPETLVAGINRRLIEGIIHAHAGIDDEVGGDATARESGSRLMMAAASLSSISMPLGSSAMSSTVGFALVLSFRI